MKCTRVSWSDLPLELLLNIAECLESRLDIQHFRAVCKTWERSIPYSLLILKNILSPHFPHSLTTSTRSWLDSSRPRSMVLVACSVFLFRSTLDPKLPPWLFMAEELHPCTLFVSEFLSPIATRKLPSDFPRSLDLSYIQVSEMAAFHRLRFADDPRDMFRMKKYTDFNDNRVVLFVDPNCSKTSPTTDDCTAIVLHHKGSLRAIRLKDEKELEVRYQRTYVKKFDNIVKFKEKVYAIDHRGRAYSMEYDTLSLLSLIEKPSLDASSERKKRLAVSSDHQDLYLLDRCCRPGTRNGVHFNVYKLNERESKWDKVEGIGDDKILFVTFDGTELLCLCSGFSRETKEDEESQFDANSQDVVPPTLFEPEPMVLEQFVEAPSTSAAQGSFSRVESPSCPLLVHDDAKQTNEIPSTSAARDRITRAETSSVVVSEDSELEPLKSTTFLVTRTSTLNELEHAADKVSHVEKSREENNITHPVSKCYIASTTQSNTSDDSTVRFKGLDIKPNLLQTLQNRWSKQMENIIISNGDIVSRALESLATAVLILEQTPLRSLNDSQADYLRTTLSDLQCMHFKVGWLVPYVEKAVQLHKSKPLIDSRDELLHRQAEVEERRSKLVDELAELDNLEEKLKKDVANATKLIPFSGDIDIDLPIGRGYL